MIDLWYIAVGTLSMIAGTVIGLAGRARITRPTENREQR